MQLGIDEWLVRLVHRSMYKNVRSRVKSRRWVQRGVWCWSGCSSGLCSKPAALYHGVRGSIQGVSHRLSLGAAVCRRPDDQCWVQGGTAGKGKDMEDRDGEKGPTCEHGENKDNGVWY